MFEGRARDLFPALGGLAPRTPLRHHSPSHFTSLPSPSAPTLDIPLRVFSESYYPNLCSLYNHLGVKYRAADYSFACLDARPGATSYFRYINLLVAGMALPVPMCLNPWHLLKFSANTPLSRSCSWKGLGQGRNLTPPPCISQGQG